jgi:outer membrane protein TolC
MQSHRASLLRCGAGLALLCVTAAPGAELTLAEAEALSTADEPGLRAIREKALALREQAVADGQLADPKLKLGVLSLPTDSFDFDQEPMTQIQVGVQQAFPAGRTLEYKSRRTGRLAAAQAATGDARALEVVEAVRRAWLETYYWVRAGQVVRESQVLFKQLVNITRSRYAAGGRNQQDVIQAELELERLQDRVLSILAKEEQARAELGRWVGPERAGDVLPNGLPELPPVYGRKELVDDLDRHPSILAESARVEAGTEAVAMARQAYKPRWMVDLTYGFRQGRNPASGTTDAQEAVSLGRKLLAQQGISVPNYGLLEKQLAPVGSERADFLSVMVLVDLPLFTHNRQDRRMAASRHETQAAMRTRESRRLELRRMLDELYAGWQRTSERLERYRTVLIPRARESAEAALTAYQSDRGDFTALMRARIAELDTRLEALRLAVDRAKAQAGLLYLAGDES